MELLELLERNDRHVSEFSNDRFDAVQDGQSPGLVTVCCSDSRVLQDELITNETPGDVFTVGVIGNRVCERTDDGATVSGDVLYPLVHAGTATAAVIGHTGCGAVTATYQDLTDGVDEPDGIQYAIDLLKDRLAPGVDALPDGLDEESAINHLVEYNVDRQVELLLESDDVPDDVRVAGLVYDFQNVYSDDRGRLQLINVNGSRTPDAIERNTPALSSRFNRLWSY